jgi:hypothetical protein
MTTKHPPKEPVAKHPHEDQDSTLRRLHLVYPVKHCDGKSTRQKTGGQASTRGRSSMPPDDFPGQQGGEAAPRAAQAVALVITQ